MLSTRRDLRHLNRLKRSVVLPRAVSSGIWVAGPIVAVGFLAYGFSLGLPFFLDDAVHFRWLEWQTLASMWSSARLIGYYRPLPFTVWKALRLVQGRYDPVTLHGVNLGLHVLNGLLLARLAAWQLNRGGLSLGLGAAVLFILYPFSYQAVPWVGSLTHMLVTFLILASLCLYRLGERAAQHAGLVRGLSVALAGIAPFAHETGAAIAPLLVCLLLTQEEPPPWRRAVRETLPYVLCAMVAVAVWALVPKAVKWAGLSNLESRWQNAVYFAQGLAYPVAPLATAIVGAGRGWSDIKAVALVAFPAIGLWSFVLWRAGRARLVTLALAWFALTAAPAWAVLGFWYVVDGPRLLYEASVGAALFWAIPTSLARSRHRSSTGVAVLAWLVVLGVACGSWGFVRSRVPMYRLVRKAVAELVAALPDEPGESVLCVNYPAWFAPLRATFALGHEGVTLLAPYFAVGDLVWLHTGSERNVTAATLPDLLHPWGYYWACAGTTETMDSLEPKVRQAGKVLVTRYDGGLAVYDAGGLEAQGGSPEPVHVAAFGDRVALLSASSTLQGSTLQVTLRWQSWRSVEDDVTVFLHLYNWNGGLSTQADGYPVMSTSRPRSWQAGDTWRDERVLSVENLPAGEYTIKVGLYRVSDGGRLPAVDSARRPIPDDAVPIGTVVLQGRSE